MVEVSQRYKGYGFGVKGNKRVYGIQGVKIRG